MVQYNAVEDPLFYPNSQVLINKLGLNNQTELDQFEQLMFDNRAKENLPDGDYDLKHYCDLHHHFFQDVYEWAGTLRNIRTGKGDNWFCYPEYIKPQLDSIFNKLKSENYLSDLAQKHRFAERAAWYISEINAVHPFREGNGRIQLVFLTILTRNAGFSFNDAELSENEFLEAMIKSFDGELEPLIQHIIQTTR
jgi:cell filamentation protein